MALWLTMCKWAETYKNGDTMASVSATREKILKAAHELFSSKGYQRSSTRDIARLACVAELTLFRHFTTKEALFDVVVGRLTAEADLEEFLPSFDNMPFEKGVHLLAQRYLEKISSIRNWFNICHSELLRGSKTVQQLYSSFIDQLYSHCNGYFRTVAQHGELRGCDSETAARLFMMLCFGNIQLDELLPGKVCRDENGKQVLDDMVRIFVDGVTRHEQQA